MNDLGYKIKTYFMKLRKADQAYFRMVVPTLLYSIKEQNPEKAKEHLEKLEVPSSVQPVKEKMLEIFFE